MKTFVLLTTLLLGFEAQAKTVCTSNEANITINYLGQEKIEAVLIVGQEALQLSGTFTVSSGPFSKLTEYQLFDAYNAPATLKLYENYNKKKDCGRGGCDYPKTYPYGVLEYQSVKYELPNCYQI